MASCIPIQTRSIDPFASNNSNVINRLVRIMTQGNNGLLNTNHLKLTIDSTSTINISPGYICKDDVLIHISENFIVDFNDPQHYYGEQVLPQEGGFHYIVLVYTYSKSRPAPTASISILKPSERGILTANQAVMLLGVVEIETATPHTIQNVYEFDPSIPDNKRKYLKLYSSFESNLPTFDKLTDQGRIVYVISENKFYFGKDIEWGVLDFQRNSLTLGTDTEGVEVGHLCYIGANGKASLAKADSSDTACEFIVTHLGDEDNGRIVVLGMIDENIIQVETGITIDIGNILYLSQTEAGKVTNVKTSPFTQVIGKALSNGNSSTPISILFSPWFINTGNSEAFDEIDTHANLTIAHSSTPDATANRIILRDSFGRAKVGAPNDPNDIARKLDVDNEAIERSNADLAHSSLTNAHNATSSALANRIIVRDSFGRAKINMPAAPDDIARKQDIDNEAANRLSVDNLLTNLINNHIASTGVHGAAVSAVNNSIVSRDSSGRIKATPGIDIEDVITIGQIQGSFMGSIWGYKPFPSNFLLQWGRIAPANRWSELDLGIITYPMQFSSVVYFVIPSLITNATPQLTDSFLGVRNITTTGFNLYSGSTVGVTYNYGAYWIAAGTYQ